MDILNLTKVDYKGSNLVLDVQVPHFLAGLAPFEVEDLIRVGGGIEMADTCCRRQSCAAPIC